MELSLIALMAISVAASTPSQKAKRFVDQFAGVCMAGYGDFAAVKQAVKAAGFRKESFADEYPESIYARRLDNVIVYRGAVSESSPNAPNCSIQSDRMPGKDAEEVAAALQERFGLQPAIRSTNCQGRPVWKWRSQQKGRDVWISLVDDVLVSDRNVRLAIMPWTDEKPACKEPVIRRVQQ